MLDFELKCGVYAGARNSGPLHCGENALVAGEKIRALFHGAKF